MRKRSQAKAESEEDKTLDEIEFERADRIEELLERPDHIDAKIKRSREAITATSCALKEELDKNEPKPRTHVEFGNANQSKLKPLSSDFERITESVFLEHPLETYKQLEADLRVGTERNDHGSLMKALDNAETNARKAHKLWMTAKLAESTWEMDNALVFAAMRMEANKTLTREKEQGLRPKQITDADVDAMCAALFSAEWAAQEVKRKKVHAMSRSMENLNEMWMSRCRSLNAMLSKQR
jgi:hypothetical protein